MSDGAAWSANGPFDVLFGGMDKLGPGDDAETLRVLRLLAEQRFRVIVDAGCGSGRQTLALARALGVRVHAVDDHAPFLAQLERRARDAGLAHLVEAQLMDMREIPRRFAAIDLLWSEGAAYNIGFGTALATWAPALRPGGCAVVSELSWLDAPAPAPVVEFFRTGYPEMRTVPVNRAIAEHAGFAVLATHALPAEAWVDGYYDVLASRATSLLDHGDPAVRVLAAETLQEIAVFERSGGSYSYVFYVLRRL